MWSGHYLTLLNITLALIAVWFCIYHYREGILVGYIA